MLMLLVPVLVVVVVAIAAVIMAAPAPMPPILPTGSYLTDGYQTLVTFSSLPSGPAVAQDIAFWISLEGGVKPGGLDTEGPIKIGTMHARRMRVMAAKKLLTHQPTTFTAFYDPKVLTQILTLLGFQTTITLTLPNGGTWAFFGYLNKFEPSDNKEGTAPTASCEIVAISRDPSLPVR